VYNNKVLKTLAAAALSLAVLSCWGCKEKEKAGEELKVRAEKLFADEKYDDATRVYDKLFLDYPAWAADKEVVAWRNLARAKALYEEARTAARTNRFDEAGEALTEALALAPDDAEINYGVGWVYIQRALEYQAQARVTRGGAQADYGLLADAHAELARERFARAIELDGKHWAGYRGMAVYYLYKGDSNEALKSLDEADKYSKKPDEKITVGRLRFRAYAGEKKFDEGKKVLDGLIEKYPDYGEAYFALGEYYLLLPEPNFDEAAQAFEVGVTKKFEESGTKGQMYVMLARLLIRDKKYDDALEAAAAALADDPFNDVFTDEFAVAWGAKKLSEQRQ
jgi:tetratricopeptide (TPR) repeat protein